MGKDPPYGEKLRDPRWLRKRENILEARSGTCELCRTTTGLTIHHGYYIPKGNPWEYEDASLWVLCWPCHEQTQAKLARIHQQLAHVHPRNFDELISRIKDVAHEVSYGVSLAEFDEMIEQKKVEGTLYRDYEVTIIASSDIGPTMAYRIEEHASTRFPGMTIYVSEEVDSPDGAAIVDGPDPTVTQHIQKWLDKLREIG